MRMTPTFSWTVPAPGQIPYAPAVRQLVHAMDGSVASVAAIPAMALMQLVMSYYPTGVTTVFSGAYNTPWPAGSGWQTLSIAPAGPCVGSFSITLPNRRALFDVRVLGPSSSSGAWDLQWVLDYRLVLNPGSITLGDVGSDASIAWNSPWIHSRFYLTSPPLSASTYSITLQARGKALSTNPIAWGSPGWITCVMRSIDA